MMPSEVVEIRKGLCDQCDFNDPCVECKHGHWGQYELCLGNKVAKVTQPIARIIDKVLGTDIQNCGGCKKRQAKLNELF